jgi:hypothetical protein
MSYRSFDVLQSPAIHSNRLRSSPISISIGARLSSGTFFSFYCGGDWSGGLTNRNKKGIIIFIEAKFIIMASIAGVTTKKNAREQITHVTVDVRKHKEVIPMFNEIGLMPKTKFQEQCEKGTLADVARQELIAHVRSFPWKK